MEANGVGSRFRSTIDHMDGGLTENDSRPLYAGSRGRVQTRLFQIPRIALATQQAGAIEIVQQVLRPCGTTSAGSETRAQHAQQEAIEHHDT